MRLRLASSLVLSTLLLAAPAAAGDPSDDPAAEKQRGDAAMDGLRFDEAIEAYTHAYALGHDPAILYNRGRVYQARSDWAKALDDLEAFDRDAGPALKAKVPKLGELLATVKAHVATISVQCDVAGAHVLVQAVDVGVTPLAATRVNAGEADIRVEAPDFTPFATHKKLEAGSLTTLDVHLVRPGATSPVPGPANKDAGRENKPLTSRWWFWTGLGVLAAGAVVTVVVVSQTEKSPDNGSGFSPGRVSGPLVVAW